MSVFDEYNIGDTTFSTSFLCFIVANIMNCAKLYIYFYSRKLDNVNFFRLSINNNDTNFVEPYSFAWSWFKDVDKDTRGMRYILVLSKYIYKKMFTLYYAMKNS